MAASLVPVSCRGGSPQFSQQGTVEWVSLSNSTFTFSVEIMSRLSKAGVEMITFAMGQTLFTRFTVPPDGQKRITDAISQLKAYSSLSDVFWFGFGLKHVIRTLCETEQGVICTGVCACLCVSYDSDFRARVLQSMCGKVLKHDGLSPSLPQWAKLVNVCAGSLAHSTFPDRVEGFCRLGHAQYTAKFKRDGVFQPTTPEALADALLSLSEVCDSTKASTTIMGGPDCGWLAAVAEWLFNLRVEVKAESGKLLYWRGTHHDGAAAQVTVIFASNEFDPTTALEIVNRTFCLPFGKFRPFGSALDKESLFIPGRSSWSTILGDTFGDTFRFLVSPTAITQFAALIVAALPRLRDYTRFHAKDWEMFNPWLNSYRSSIDMSRIREQSAARSFFDNAVAQLPELAPLLEERDTIASPARQHDDFHDVVLKSLCGCSLCVDATEGRPRAKHSPDFMVVHPSTSEEHSLEETGNNADFNNDFCLLRVVSSIFRLLWLLSWLSIDRGVQPTSTGLLWLYEHHAELIDSDKLRDQTYSSRWRDTIRLFLGSSCELASKNKPCSAVSHEGLCLYLPALENITLAPPQQLLLRVIPGGLAWRDRTYQAIWSPKINTTAQEVERCAFMWSTFSSFCFRVIPVIQVRETVRSENLETWIGLIPEKISKQSHAYISALNKLGADSTKSGKDRHPLAEVTADIRFFLNSFEESIVIYDCHQTSIQVLIHTNVQGEITKQTSVDTCTEVESFLWASIEDASYHRPELNELVLFFWAKVSGSLVLHLIRSDTTMLYYLFNRFVNVVRKHEDNSIFSSFLNMPGVEWTRNNGLIKRTPRLMYIGKCLLCCVRHSARPATEGDQVIIHTIRDNRHTCLVLLSQWRDPEFGKPFAHQAKYFTRREDNEQYIPITIQEHQELQNTPADES